MIIELKKIKDVMLENNIEETVADAVIAQLEEEVIEEVQPEAVVEEPTNDELTDNTEDLPKTKWEYVIILADKEGYLKDKEIAGWIVQQEENADAATILSKLKDAAKEQNENAKRKKNSITSLVDLFDGLKSKFLRDKYVKIKTKDLTRCIISSGKF